MDHGAIAVHGHEHKRKETGDGSRVLGGCGCRTGGVVVVVERQERQTRCWDERETRKNERERDWVERNGRLCQYVPPAMSFRVTSLIRPSQLINIIIKI